MNHVRLQRTIGTLNNTEKRKFRKFLQSPYFNTRTDVLELFDSLAQSNVEPELNEQDEKNRRLVASYLFRLLEQFMIFEEMQQNTTALSWHLAHSYKKRRLKTDAERVMGQALDALQEDPLRNAGYFDWLYHLRFEQLYDRETTPAEDEAPVRQLFEALDHAWLARKLRQICLLLNRKKVYRMEVPIAFLPEAIQYVETENLKEHPVIGAYYFAYRLLSEESAEPFFQQLKTALFDHAACFSLEELRELHLIALNFCIRQINVSNRSYFHEALDLYREGLHKDTLLENGYLSRFTYHNIVAAGLQCGELTWVDHFMDQYKNAMERTYRDSTYSFNRAKLAYARGRLRDALGLLQTANYRDLLLNLPAKALALKIYYELDEPDVLQNHLTAMRTFIHRKRVIGYHRTNYLNLIRLTQRLLTINVFDKKALQELRRQVQAEEPLTEKEWLLEQVEKLV
jgi:hypothetical protein